LQAARATSAAKHCLENEDRGGKETKAVWATSVDSLLREKVSEETKHFI
jgi:hypothetical protein